MRGINHVILFGLLGHDVELRTTPNGKSVTELRLATNHAVKKDEGWVEVADWHRVTLWDSQAELAAKLLKKGTPVGVEGELRTESWTDSAEQKHSKTYIMGRRLHLSPFKRFESGAMDGAAGPEEAEGAPEPAAPTQRRPRGRTERMHPAFQPDSAANDGMGSAEIPF
jgi:single-strand DNA-binding protein